MSSPAIRPRNHQPSAGPGGAKGSPQKLRVHSEDVAPPAAAPSIAMPRAKTELSELLAADKLLCVRPRPPATAMRADADSGSDGPRADVGAKVESRHAHPVDMDLSRVVDAWAGLPHNVRAAILAIIRETASGDAP